MEVSAIKHSLTKAVKISLLDLQVELSELDGWAEPEMCGEMEVFEVTPLKV